MLGCKGKRIKMIGLSVGMTVVMALAGMTTLHAQEPGADERAAIAGEAVSTQEWQVMATSPGVTVVTRSIASPGQVLPDAGNPQEAAYNWLLDEGYEEGRNEVGGKLLYISVGSAIINATPASTDFIDSRYLAFQRAELEAKAKTALFIGVDLSTERGSSEREINPRERAELERLVNASPELQKNLEKEGIAGDVYELFKKAKRLVEAKLDKSLQESGVDVQAEKRQAERKKTTQQARQNRVAQLASVSEASLKAAASAFAEVEGVQTIQVFEGSYKNDYQVVVVTLWSQNMQRMVDIMSRGAAPNAMPTRKAKEEVSRQLPQKPEELACLTGVRVYINQNGEYTLLAFGQAGVEILGGREGKAYELAGKKARLRGMAAIRNFMGEKVAFTMTEELREALALYVDEAQGGTGNQEYRSISQFQEMIKAQANKQKISGIHDLVSRELVHPFTDKPLVLKVMAWSPASMAAAADVRQAIEHGAEKIAPKKAAAATPAETGPARKGLISSGKGADKSAF